MVVFYVFQGKSYHDEKNGGYVWSPQKTKNGRNNIGFTTMTYINKNDYILHSFKGSLVAVSIAQTDYYPAEKPSENDSWANDGYKVDTLYYELEVPLKVIEYQAWLEDNYIKDSAFRKDGKGKQQYMSTIHAEHASYLLKQSIELQRDKTIIKILKDALMDITADKKGEYELIELEEINDLIDSQRTKKVDWSGDKKPQEMTMSYSAERERPKRNPKYAANALARADYRCEYNKNDRIFERKSGKGYTEPHHLIPISKYRDFDYQNCSLDTMENIVSLCSHCHNLLHYGKYKDKESILRKLYNERKDALSKVGLDISFDDLIKYYR